VLNRNHNQPLYLMRDNGLWRARPFSPTNRTGP
jgi:hypothetical protein